MTAVISTLLLTGLIVLPGIFAQIGVKTHVVHQPPPAGSLVLNNTYGAVPYNGSNVPYGSSSNTGLEATIRHSDSAYSGFGSETDRFINQTRSIIPAGVCWEEVPTVSLVTDSRYVPAGNGSNPSLSRVQVCCEGYERNIHNFRQCDPVCVNDCPNGICVSPNVCKCFPDHVQNLAGFCIPTCPIGCGNGHCLASGICECKPGYTLHSNGKYCVPRCTGCSNGNCTAPEVCDCKPGYARNANVNAPEKCIPSCGECRNGFCSAPGECTCLAGLAKRGNVCEAVCLKGCNNGDCIAPNVCQCRPGYTLDPTGSNCLAHCDKTCLNGYCTGANICSCNPGYILDEYNWYLCRPHCPSGCVNGLCNGPNMCSCNVGYVKDRSIKGSQACVPRS